MADTPQGSLIVILKDSTKSTWQFTRTDGAGLGVGDTHTHTPGRAHTCCEAPWPRMHTLTHMPTNNTHTPPPPATAQHPHWPARAAWIWGMQPLGTLKHTRGLSHNTEARPHTGGIAPAPCILVPGVLRGPPAMLHKGQILFLRVQLSLLCPRAFHDSCPHHCVPSSQTLLWTLKVLQPAPLYHGTQGNHFLFCLIPSAHCSGQWLSSMHPMLNLCPHCHSPQRPPDSPPPELYLRQPSDLCSQATLKLPGLLSSPRQGHDLPNVSRVLARLESEQVPNLTAPICHTSVQTWACQIPSRIWTYVGS